MSATAGPHAVPMQDLRLEECRFYHTVELPGYGLISGEWDLRGGERAYLGGIELRERSVLEIGASSGYLTFHMEREGADVDAFDLGAGDDVDVVPYAQADLSLLHGQLRGDAVRVSNAWWLSHRALHSHARLTHGNVYALPESLGSFDVVTFGSVLLHLRDPFLALQQGCGRARETVVITDRGGRLASRLPAMIFRPNARRADPPVTWWRLTPDVVRRMIAVLGFEDSVVSFHRQCYGGRRYRFFTVVGRRTVPFVER